MTAVFMAQVEKLILKSRKTDKIAVKCNRAKEEKLQRSNLRRSRSRMGSLDILAVEANNTKLHMFNSYFEVILFPQTTTWILINI